MPDYDAFYKFRAAGEEATKNNAAEEERKAAEARKRGQPAPKTALQEFQEIVDIEKHSDYLFRTLASNIKPVPAGTLPYIAVARFRVERGKFDDFRKFYDQYFKPAYEKLLAEGAIHGYGLLQEDWLSLEPGTLWGWVRMPNTSAVDKLVAAFRAADATRSPIEREHVSARLRDLTVPGVAHEELLRAEIFNGPK